MGTIALGQNATDLSMLADMLDQELYAVSEILVCYKGGAPALKRDPYFMAQIANPHHIDWLNLSECFDESLVEMRRCLHDACDPSHSFWSEEKKWGYETRITEEKTRAAFEKEAEYWKASHRAAFARVCDSIDIALARRSRMRASSSPQQALCEVLRMRARRQMIDLAEAPNEIFTQELWRKLLKLKRYQWLFSWVDILPPWQHRLKTGSFFWSSPCIDEIDDLFCPYCVRSPCRWKE